jgi:calcium/calmodulin-dependent protein kinase I
MIGPHEIAFEPFGTIGYVAPEILKKQGYSFSCDIWSIGCIFYVLLSGKLPFDHADKKEIIRRTMFESVLFDDDELWDEISLKCKSFILMLLIKDPDQRPSLQTVSEHSIFCNVHKTVK